MWGRSRRAPCLGDEDDAGTVFGEPRHSASSLGEVLAEPSFREQPVDGVTYAEKIVAADRELDLSRPREALNRIRALSPHIGARAVVDGRPLIVWKARIGDDGELELLDVQPEGRRRMGYDEYLRGLR
jgi:methionyl-tRNA formyltransferase